MSNRMKISMLVRGFIVGALGTLAIVAPAIVANHPMLPVLDEPQVVIVAADFSAMVDLPERMVDGAVIPIEVQFE
jgi:hypothetical protein